MNGNELTVELAAFKLAMKRFRQFRNRPYRGRRYRKVSLCPQALIAFKDGYLSIEADDEVVALHAKGEWHGRATLSAAYLAALEEAPPLQSPLTLRYADGRLHMGTLSLGCGWELESESMIRRVENPGIIDLLALDKTLSRAEARGKKLGKRISQAKREAGNAVTRASKLLGKLGITRAELWELVDERTQQRIEKR